MAKEKQIVYSVSGNECKIIIKRGLAEEVCRHLPLEGVVRIAIVTDSNVAPLYLAKIKKQLCDAVQVYSCVLQAGEQNKTMASVQRLYGFFDEAGITRTDLIIALGGGVVGDITGFAAATFLRGVPIVQMPTTLLAMTDSSIGGKTGVDLPSGKNRVGAFFQPHRVLIDPEFLSSLPSREYACGMGEVIKYACIKDKKLFESLKSGVDSEEMICLCAGIKADTVQKDPFDTSERKLLNFGHTVGHALERLYGYSVYSHGEAVAAGMCMLRRANILWGGIAAAKCDEIEELCRKYSLPVYIPFDERLKEYICGDKKLEGRQLKLVVLEDIGRAKIVSVLPEELYCTLTEQYAAKPVV